LKFIINVHPTYFFHDFSLYGPALLMPPRIPFSSFPRDLPPFDENLTDHLPVLPGTFCLPATGLKASFDSYLSFIPFCFFDMIFISSPFSSTPVLIESLQRLSAFLAVLLVVQVHCFIPPFFFIAISLGILFLPLALL